MQPGQGQPPQGPPQQPQGQPMQPQSQPMAAQQPAAAAPPAPAAEGAAQPCGTCGGAVQYVAQYQRNYCGTCQKYV